MVGRESVAIRTTVIWTVRIHVDCVAITRNKRMAPKDVSVLISGRDRAVKSASHRMRVAMVTALLVGIACADVTRDGLVWYVTKKFNPEGVKMLNID